MAKARYFYFSGTSKEIEDRIRWCRANFGVRGRDTWDFIGGHKKVNIGIYDPKMQTMYIMWFGEGTSEYNPNHLVT